MRVAGLAPINVEGVENVNVTSLVPGHMAYRAAMPRVLREVGWTVESDEFAEIEDPDPENHDARQRELINEIEEARKAMKDKPQKKRFGFWGRSKKRGEKKEWETYDERPKSAEGEEDPEALNNVASGVLFDIEALRKEAVELASQGVDLKEVPSTMPPLRTGSSTNVNSSPILGSTGRPGLAYRETRSYDGGSLPLNRSGTASPSARSFDYHYDEYEPRTNGQDNHITMSFEADHERPMTPTPKRAHTFSPSNLGKAPACEDKNDGEITMTFDSRHPRSASASPQRTPAGPSRLGRMTPLDYPREDVDLGDLSQARHQPTAAKYVASNGIHNAWADEEDEDFGREKEVEMSFE